MRIPESLPILLRTLREERRLSQAELACRAALSQQRVSEVERGVCRASRAFLDAVCKVLEIDVDEVIRRTRWTPGRRGRPKRPVERRFEEVFAPQGLYVPHYERSLAQRLPACREAYSALFSHLEYMLSERSDLLELSEVLAEWPTESRVEVLHVYWLCVFGMKEAVLSPARLGYSGPELYDWEAKRHVGHLRMRALVAEEMDLSIVVWAQVPVRVRDADGQLHHFRVDNLFGLMGNRGAVWGVIEVDGAGHDFSRDEERTALLGVPVLRVGERALLADDWNVTLLRELRQVYSDHAPSVRRRLVGRKPLRPRSPRWKKDVVDAAMRDERAG